MKELLIILTSVVLVAAARADTTVFDTFGPGDTYNAGLAYQIGGGANNEEIAAQFTAGASGNLANVALGLTYFLGTDPAFRAVNVFLYGDASGSPDNANQTLLGSTTPIALFDGVTNNSVVSFSVAGTVPVTMGSLYYVVLKPTSLGTTDAWMLSSPIVTGAAFASFNDSTWAEGNSHTLPAFRLTVASAVPDSGHGILLMLGAIAALFVFQRVAPNQRPIG